MVWTGGHRDRFPAGDWMAATWDIPLMHEVATVISDEARAKHHEFVRNSVREINTGLTFWTPNINIFRDPRWDAGRKHMAKTLI